MAYDGLNRVRSITYPNDKANQRKTAVPKYNRGGALQSMKFDNTDYIKEIAYNTRGQRVLMASGSLMQRYAYDPQTFRLVRTEARKYTKSGNTYTPAAGIRLDRGYEHDLMGSVVEERDRTPASAASQGPGSIDRVFGHDPLRRLLSATGRESTAALSQPSWDLNVRPQDYTATNTYTRSYTYDKLGNIQELRHVADGIPANNFNRNYNYPSGFGSNMLESMGIGASTYQYTYDANSLSRHIGRNQTKENTDRYYEWNYSDKLAFFKRQAGTSNPTVWSHYFYDASGQRIKKVVNKPGGIQEMTVYVDGVFEHSYVRINNNVDNNRNYNTLHILDGSSRIATLRVGNDSQDSTPALKYYVEDHLGNCSVAVLSNGNRINLEEYYPFGETSFGSFAKKRYRYNGKEKDEHTGLYEYGQRYYAPWLCRFVSVDPIAEDYPQLSSYNYAGNKPETSVDIEGLQGTEDNKVITDGAGNDAIIDSGATIVEADTAVISQEGDKYVNVNGVGLVKESLLQEENIESFNPGLDPNSKTGYVYNADDFEMRAKLMKSPLFERTVLSMERDGMTEPLTRKGYEEKWGSAGGIMFFGNMLQAGMEVMPGLHLPSTPKGRVFRAKSRPEISLKDKGKIKQGDQLNAKTKGEVKMNAEVSENHMFGNFDFGDGRTIDFGAEYNVIGNRLELTEMVFYPRGAKGNEFKKLFGGRSMVNTLQELQNFAKMKGHSQLRVQFARGMKSSSAKPGKIFDKTFNLK